MSTAGRSIIKCLIEEERRNLHNRLHKKDALKIDITETTVKDVFTFRSPNRNHQLSDKSTSGNKNPKLKNPKTF